MTQEHKLTPPAQLTLLRGWRKATASNPSGCCLELGVWQKAAASQGASNCLEVNGVWVKARASSGNANCLQASALTAADLTDEALAQHPKARDSDVLVLVRDSKLGEASPVLIFSRPEWEAAAMGFRAGEFDLPPAPAVSE